MPDNNYNPTVEDPAEGLKTEAERTAWYTDFHEQASKATEKPDLKFPAPEEERCREILEWAIRTRR